MIKNIIKEAFILKNKGYYKHAIETLYKALEYDNNSPELLYEIADLYHLINDNERASNYIEQALDINPTHIESLELLKKIFIKNKLYKQAEETARNIFIISKNADDFAKILELLNSQKKYNDVISQTEDFENKNSNILYEIAFAKLFSNQANDALEEISKAINFEPENNKFKLLKSKILFKLDKKEESKEILESLEINSSDSDILNFIGLVKQDNCEFDSALEYFLEAIKISPNNDEYLYNCGSTYFKKGDTSLAKKYYNLALSLNPDNQNYHFALANLYYSEKNYKRAMEELAYDFYEAKLLKSIILYDSGYLSVARKYILELEKERPENDLVQEYRRKIEEELKI